MTVTRKTRLVPTGGGCGAEAAIGSWFVRGHDITAAAALRALQGMRLPQQLVSLGFGPERSVVQAAVDEVGWVRCPGCAYAGTPVNLAAHTRAGSCTAGVPGDEQPQAQPEPESGVEPAVAEQVPAAPAGSEAPALA
uniref:hypothetical protein n=1 Tax=Streptomyces olivaceus TaxID=47716 RepID=UPI004056E893